MLSVQGLGVRVSARFSVTNPYVQHPLTLPLFKICQDQFVIVAKLLYASPAWSGFTIADDRQRVSTFLRRSKRCGFCRQELPTFEELLENSDEQLFNMIINNTQHVLYSLLPPPSAASQHYQLIQGTHNLQLP